MNDSRDDALPDPLARDLDAMYRADIRVPPQLDRAITSAARAHLAHRSSLRPLLRWGGAAAAAAALLLAVLLLSRPARPHLAQTNGDINNDGVVDIRDALNLARNLDARTIKEYDVNHDGVTDRRDVDAIAMRAVKLEGAGAIR